MPHAYNKSSSSFRQKFWHEAEPLIIHTGLILILELTLLVIGLVTMSLERLFPNHSRYFTLIEQIDILVALALLCLFGLSTLIRILVRLALSIVVEVGTGVDIVGESVGKMSRGVMK